MISVQREEEDTNECNCEAEKERTASQWIASDCIRIEGE